MTAEDAGRSDPHIVDVTPEMANRMLDTMEMAPGVMSAQRKLKPHLIKSYAADMAAGRWTLDSNALCFDRAGVLVNGQHRLNAVIWSGCTVPFIVIRDMPPEAILHMDSGATRSTADQLQVLAVPNAAQVAAITRTVIMYEAAPGIVWNGQAVKILASQSLQVDYVRQRSAVLQAACQEANRLNKSRFNRTVTGALYVLVNDHSANADLWDDYITGAETGANLRPLDPRLALRNYWVRPDLRSWGGNQAHLITTIIAWNKYLVEDDVRLFKTPRREQLPMPKVK